MILETFLGLVNKRFIGLMVCVPAVLIGLLAGPRELFGELCAVIGGLYLTYTAGQSFTDAKETNAEVAMATK